MASGSTDSIESFEEASDRISWIRGYESEAEVQAAASEIVAFFGLKSLVFGVFFRFRAREHYRFLVGCVPDWCYLYAQNKWYAIDPLIDYALENSSPALASDIKLSSAGQARMMAKAAECGFRSGIVIPAHSRATARIGILYLGTGEGSKHARQSLLTHRNLMRALGMELLEWWDAKLHAFDMESLELDELDLALLGKAQEQATAEEAAHELGVTLSRVKSRYERLARKLEVFSKRSTVEKAVELGLIKGPWSITRR